MHIVNIGCQNGEKQSVWFADVVKGEENGCYGIELLDTMTRYGHQFFMEIVRQTCSCSITGRHPEKENLPCVIIYEIPEKQPERPYACPFFSTVYEGVSWLDDIDFGNLGGEDEIATVTFKIRPAE